jgi:hypothetical protein
MTWAEFVAFTRKREVCRGIWWGNLKEEDHLEDTFATGRIILKWPLKI